MYILGQLGRDGLARGIHGLPWMATFRNNDWMPRFGPVLGLSSRRRARHAAPRAVSARDLFRPRGARIQSRRKDPRGRCPRRHLRPRHRRHARRSAPVRLLGRGGHALRWSCHHARHALRRVSLHLRRDAALDDRPAGRPRPHGAARAAQGRAWHGDGLSGGPCHPRARHQGPGHGRRVRGLRRA